jgi:hypothetical protein
MGQLPLQFVNALGLLSSPFYMKQGTYRSSGRRVTQPKKYHFSGEATELLFLIRVFKIE